MKLMTNTKCPACQCNFVFSEDSLAVACGDRNCTYLYRTIAGGDTSKIRREIAIEMLAALISGGHTAEGMPALGIPRATERAIEYADALIQELSKPKG